MKKPDFQKLKRYLPWILGAVMLLSVTLVPMAIHGADFGDFAGDNDYGGGGGGGSWDDDDDDGGGAVIWWLFRVVYELFGVPGVIVLLLIFVGIYIARKKLKGSRSTPVQTQVQRTDRASLSPMHSYYGLDPHFDEAAFREKLSNLYVQFQNAWQAKNMESLRPYMTDAMYGQYDRQLDAYRQRGQTNHIERIAVLSVELAGWRQVSGKDMIVAEIRTRIVDYVTDDRTGQIVRGSSTQEKFMTYEWTLVRTSGQLTGQQSGTTGQTCPYCGAHIDINHTAVCEYCGGVLTTDTFDWVVSGIKGLSQQTR
ncbi:MAG: TIM44-like domain-containing protein [Oscillospiraceae bacterium]|nr:TIM44-like domain-containing protein [Oscillospiraceae bacterium]